MKNPFRYIRARTEFSKIDSDFLRRNLEMAGNNPGSPINLAVIMHRIETYTQFEFTRQDETYLVRALSEGVYYQLQVALTEMAKTLATDELIEIEIPDGNNEPSAIQKARHIRAVEMLKCVALDVIILAAKSDEIRNALFRKLRSADMSELYVVTEFYSDIYFVLCGHIE